MRRTAVVAATAILAVALVTPAANASQIIQPGIYDDAQVLYGNPDKVFPVLKQMKTKLLRANLWWGGSPLTVASRRPARATDPNDPAYRWGTYDRTVLYAKRYGIKVVFSVLGTPAWANGAKGWRVAPTDAGDLRDFAVAAARRYSGSFVGPDGKRLPRVPYWLAWNEPNNPVFLKPQYARVGGVWQPVSAQAYASICNAVVGGVHSVSRSLKVGCGVTAPRGNNNPNSLRPSVSPLPFLRAMVAAGAKGFDAYAHHPYYGSKHETPSTPPPTPALGQAPTAVTLGNFQTLTRELVRLRLDVRVWVTEYGYQTNPPDTLFGVDWYSQGQFMKQAYAKLKANPRVDMFIWFLLRDEVRPDGWQSGVYTSSGVRKNSREVFEGLAKVK